MDDQWRLVNPNWRNEPINELVMLSSGFITTEKDVYYAIEKLTPYLLKKEGRHPTERDIERFILMMRP